MDSATPHHSSLDVQLHRVLDELDQREQAREMAAGPEHLAERVRALYLEQGRELNEADLAEAIQHLMQPDLPVAMAPAPDVERPPSRLQRWGDRLRRGFVRAAQHLGQCVGDAMRRLGLHVLQALLLGLKVAIILGLSALVIWAARVGSQGIHDQQVAQAKAAQQRAILVEQRLGPLIEALQRPAPDYAQLRQLVYTSLPGMADTVLQRRQTDGRPRVILTPGLRGTCDGIVHYFADHPDELAQTPLMFDQVAITNLADLNTVSCPTTDTLNTRYAPSAFTLGPAMPAPPHS